MDEAFQERLEELPEINGEEKAAYIEKNRELLKEHFVPAYEKLAEGLEAVSYTHLSFFFRHGMGSSLSVG